jgi:hypothetical protein
MPSTIGGLFLLLSFDNDNYYQYSKIDTGESQPTQKSCAMKDRKYPDMAQLFCFVQF